MLGEATKEPPAFAAGCKDEYNAVMKKMMQRCAFHIALQNPGWTWNTG